MEDRLSSRRTIVDRIVNELFNPTTAEKQRLGDMLARVELYNRSPTIVYHDIHHLYAVVINSYKLGKIAGLTNSDLKLLFIAALFHDFNHSYGNLNDTINVASSISAFTNLFTKNGQFASMFTREEIEIISDAIFCTVFPFRVEPKNKIEECLRQADLTMSFEEDAELFAQGLTAEFKTAGKDITATVPDMNSFVKQTDPSVFIAWEQVKQQQWWNE